MSQPKSQLETFRAWAGKDSDIRQVIHLSVFQSVKSNNNAYRSDVGIATTSHRTTSTYAVGSSKERRFQPALWPAPRRASRRENRTIVSPRPRIPSHFSSTGSPSQARSTGGLRSILLPGLLHRTRASTLPSTGTIWRKRFAFRS